MNQFLRLQVQILVFLLLITVNTTAQNKTNSLNDLFSALAQNQQFNGNILVAENGKIIFEKSFGYADFETKTALNKKSSFPIASLSKTMTSTAILQLKAKGKLKLEDPVINYLPEFPYPAITIRQLLNQTSGLLDYFVIFNTEMTANPEKIFTNADILPVLKKMNKPLSSEPGAKWEYNNLNYCLLAVIVEKLSGIAFQTYLQKNIFEPAGMKSTYLPAANDQSKNKTRAELYQFRNGYSDKLENINTLPKSNLDRQGKFVGQGGVVSTVNDLFKYDQALYNGKLLKESELQEAFTPAKLNNGETVKYIADGKEVSYGLGWEIYLDASQGKIVYHDGLLEGLVSIFFRNLTKKQTVIAIDNTANHSAVIGGLNALNILNQQPLINDGKSLARAYGSVLVSQGADAAKTILDKLKKDSNYSLRESDMNRLGYELLRNGKNLEALEVFKLNVELFPDSWNVYDSYGEILLKIGRKEEAIKMYQKSIDLNPENENGKNVLKQLLNN